MEKRKPTYDLESFKKSKFGITKTATDTAAALGYTVAEVRSTVKKMEPSHFKKSMTAQFDHALWQDVYNVPTDEGILYIKFSSDSCTEFKLLSFKEK